LYWKGARKEQCQGHQQSGRSTSSSGSYLSQKLSSPTHLFLHVGEVGREVDRLLLVRLDRYRRLHSLHGGGAHRAQAGRQGVQIQDQDQGGRRAACSCSSGAEWGWGWGLASRCLMRRRRRPSVAGTSASEQTAAGGSSSAAGGRPAGGGGGAAAAGWQQLFCSGPWWMECRVSHATTGEWEWWWWW